MTRDSDYGFPEDLNGLSYNIRGGCYSEDVVLSPRLRKTMKRFRDRTDAGKQLAALLAPYANRADVLVLGLPRGGVPVAYEVAKALKASLDICVVRKLGVPWHQELAMGAIALGGVRVLNEDVVHELNIMRESIEQITIREQEELERRERAYRGDRPPPDIHDRTVILVDDGLATGATMRAAVEVVRSHHPQRIIVAVPLAPISIYEDLRDEVDEMICLKQCQTFHSISHGYLNFSQVSDKQVRKLLIA